jgi:hypothetical protein
MRRLHLVDAVADENGIGYRASDDADAFVNLMQTDYSASLRECAEWVVSVIGVEDPATAAKARNPHLDEWVADQGVALIQLDWQGDVVAVIGGRGYAGDADKIAWQVATRGDERKQLAFSIDLIARKIAASIVTLETVIPPSAARNKALEKARGVLAELEAKPPADLTALRLLEAISANTYFSAWRGLALTWKANARVPIPDAWRSYSSRASTANGAKFKNVRATHPINAMLNYAYGVRQVSSTSDLCLPPPASWGGRVVDRHPNQRKRRPALRGNRTPDDWPRGSARMDGLRGVHPRRGQPKGVALTKGGRS